MTSVQECTYIAIFSGTWQPMSLLQAGCSYPLAEASVRVLCLHQDSGTKSVCAICHTSEQIS